MSGILLILTVILCIACYTGQTFFNKLFSLSYPGTAEQATPVFAGIYGGLVAFVTLCLSGFRFAPSGLTWLLGGFNGIILFLYNLGMIQAARRGPYAFQSIVMLFGSIVVCLVFSAAFWGDRITILQLCGIAVMLAAFVVFNCGGLKFSNIKKGYFFWVISLFLTNGFYGVLMDAQQRMAGSERNEMIVITFAASALVSLLYLAVTQKGRAPEAFRMGKKAGACAVISSLCAAFAVFVLMLLLAYIPSYVLYTVNNGSILVLSALLCAAVLKEKLTRETYIGIALSVVSLIMLSV